MLNHPGGRPRWVVNLHMTTSLLAVILSWVLSHIYSGFHYMRLYYDDTIIDGKLTYRMGLEFPQRETADFWDFTYYSFTIAMCYQTSDVTVTSVRIRPRHPCSFDLLVSLRYRDHRFRGQRNLECYLTLVADGAK
jgi:uncharacterized membrane protein